MIVPISEVKTNPNNPRLIKDEKFKKLVKSIQDFPEMLELRPIVVNDDMVVLGGNMRLKACKEAGLKEVPIIKASFLTPEQQREFIIKDNVGFGEWDWDLIANEWDAQEVTDWGLDIPDFKIADAEEDDYEIPDEIQTDIVLGDLFEIGEHRLLCGDSTNADDVAKVLNGKEPYLMVTDPPYGVEYDASWRDGKGLNRRSADTAVGKVTNDDNADWTGSWSLSPSRVAYVWSSDRFAFQTVDPLIKSGFEVRNQIIWAKNQIVISRGNYHPQHEPCWYAVKKGNKGNWAGDRKQSTLWQIDKPMKSETGHSTQKPVECMARPVANHDGDVYDPFLGSGTTMVAAHQLNRKCYGIEIDPKYCQVIVDRMKKLDPSLVVKRNGQTV
jgi:DNA modification methylase